MDGLETLRLRAMALRSSVHNEHQLSAIELTAMNAKKTNEIIAVIDELINKMEKIEAEHELILNYDGSSENLNLEVITNE